MKGIILAGGCGTRLYPSTLCLSKQLLPVYDKPMIYYSLTTLMLAGIKEILIITNPEYLDTYQSLLGTGKQFGIDINYATQLSPKGIADAFLIAEDFIRHEKVCLILGDNLFYYDKLSTLLQNATKNVTGATVFLYHVKKPERYGVVSFDEKGNVKTIEEKPTQPKSNYAVTGLYFYDYRVFEYAKSIKPSLRGELEITDINTLYLENNELETVVLSRGAAWFDVGTPKSLLEAAQFIAAIEERTGLKIACPEEVAWRMGYIQNDDLMRLAYDFNHDYGEYLKKVVLIDKQAGRMGILS